MDLHVGHLKAMLEENWQDSWAGNSLRNLRFVHGQPLPQVLFVDLWLVSWLSIDSASFQVLYRGLRLVHSVMQVEERALFQVVLR